MDFGQLWGEFLAYWRKVPRPLRMVIRWAAIIILAIIVDFSLAYLLASLTALNVVDWKTVVSLVIVEAAAVVIAKLLRVGEPSDIEEQDKRLRIAASKAFLIPQFAHLQAIYLEKEGTSINPPHSHYYIVNTKTKIAYITPTYIDDLVQEDVISWLKFKSETQQEEHLKNNEIKKELRYPKNDELGVWN